ncbi:hypothetical protein HDU77_007805 [Chytriomyces hyalinus]|nr:hypothetical protein HDU77_007805 [Chytriomyces hyalinus]
MSNYIATIMGPASLSTAFDVQFHSLCIDSQVAIGPATVLVHGTESDASPLLNGIKVTEIQLSIPNGSESQFRRTVFDASAKAGFNVAVQQNSIFRRHKRLAVFDMDSTLIQQEVIDEIARSCGVVDQVAKITEAAMNGELDFKESLAKRVGLLKGTPVSVLDTVRDKITFTPGVRELCKALKKLGFTLAVISGGFLPLAKYVKNELGLDYAYANQLEVSADGKTLEGRTFGPIVDGTRKAELLDVIAQTVNVSANQVLAVGDGANDLPMLGVAGLGVAFNAKPRVQEQAEVCLNQPSLIYVLTLLGLSFSEIQELLL